MVVIRQASGSQDIDTAQALLLEYLEWLHQAVPISEHEVLNTSGMFQKSIAELHSFMPPTGRLLLAEHQGDPVGMAWLKPLRQGTAEIKRMFIRPEARRKGVAQNLIARLIDEAKAIGYQRILLDTGPTMTAAQSLYESVGFTRCEPYQESEVGADFDHKLVYMEMDISATPNPRMIEETSANAWPALETTLYDGWILRQSAGVTKRSNSAWPLYTSTIDLKEKVDHCEEFYHQRGLPAIFKLTRFSNPAGIDGELANRGYVVVDPTSVQMLDLVAGASGEDARGATIVGNGSGQPARYNVTIQQGFSKEWVNAYLGRTPSTTPTTGTGGNSAAADQDMVTRELFRKTGHPVVTAMVAVESQPVGFGYVVIDRGVAGLHSVTTEARFRRQGIGKAVTGALIEAAQQAGARQMYLGVVKANEPAVRLYAGFGFTELYPYWYRSEPQQ